MAPALPFPAHKHPPSTAGALGLLNGMPGLPADQGDSAAIEEGGTAVEAATDGAATEEGAASDASSDGMGSDSAAQGTPPASTDGNAI